MDWVGVYNDALCLEGFMGRESILGGVVRMEYI